MFTKYNNLKSTVLHHYLNETTYKKHTHTHQCVRRSIGNIQCKKEKTDMNCNENDVTSGGTILI